MSEILQCWKCSGSLSDLLLPLSRRAECPACRAELHVCRMCAFHDPRVTKACREPVADEVVDKNRANFCGYFQPAPTRRQGAPDAASSSRAELGALFGAEPDQHASSPDLARARLEDLFGK